MNANEMTAIRELTAQELNEVNGGASLTSREGEDHGSIRNSGMLSDPCQPGNIIVSRY